MSDGSVVKLASVSAGFLLDDTADLGDWLGRWAENIKTGQLGSIGSVVVVIEATDGQLAIISQSVDRLFDRARLIGLLTYAAHQRMDGGAQVEDLIQ